MRECNKAKIPHVSVIDRKCVSWDGIAVVTHREMQGSRKLHERRDRHEQLYFFRSSFFAIFIRDKG